MDIYDKLTKSKTILSKATSDILKDKDNTTSSFTYGEDKLVVASEEKKSLNSKGRFLVHPNNYYSILINQQINETQLLLIELIIYTLPVLFLPFIGFYAPAIQFLLLIFYLYDHIKRKNIATRLFYKFISRKLPLYELIIIKKYTFLHEIVHFLDRKTLSDKANEKSKFKTYQNNIDEINAFTCENIFYMEEKGVKFKSFEDFLMKFKLNFDNIEQKGYFKDLTKENQQMLENSLKEYYEKLEINK